MRSIFHLHHSGDRYLLFHPFRRRGDIIRILGTDTVSGFYGAEPNIESMTLFRSEMYRRIEHEMNEWISANSFLLRFSFASAVFVVIYFIVSTIILDPLKVIDEFAISLCISSAAFYFIRGRRRISRAATKQRALLRSRIDAIQFRLSPLLVYAEHLIERYLSGDAPDLVTLIRSGDHFSWEHDDKQETGAESAPAANIVHELVNYLAKRFNSRRCRNFEHGLLRNLAGSKKSDPRYLHAANMPNNTIPHEASLFLLYIALKYHLQQA